MTKFKAVDKEIWGYCGDYVNPLDLIQKLEMEVEARIASYDVIPSDKEPYESDLEKPIYRVSVILPMEGNVYDQFFNGRGGYRAQYYFGVENGKLFNQIILEKIARLIINAEHLYKDRYDRNFITKSLLGSYSKFWFSKEITDPAAHGYLLQFEELITPPEWQKYWNSKPEPRKGLLVILPEEKQVLLNGTFIDESTGKEIEQKPGRSLEIHEKGWT